MSKGRFGPGASILSSPSQGAASYIAMAGDEIIMPENAFLMIHDPSGIVMGTAADMRGMAGALTGLQSLTAVGSRTMVRRVTILPPHLIPQARVLPGTLIRWHLSMTHRGRPGRARVLQTPTPSHPSLPRRAALQPPTRPLMPARSTPGPLPMRGW